MKTDNLAKFLLYFSLTGVAIGVPWIVGTRVRERTTDYFRKEGIFRGYEIVTSIDGRGRLVNITDKEINSKYEDGFIYGLDKNKDGRFDEIGLTDIPLGHPLEKYANLDSLEVAYDEIRNKGE